MKRHYGSLIFLHFILSALLGACTLNPTSRNGLSVSISEPSQGAVLPLAPFAINADATSSTPPGVTVRNIAFLANGETIGRDTELDVYSEPTYQDYMGFISWTPTEPGEYFLQAMTSRTLTISRPVRICIIDFQIPPPTADRYQDPFGYEGPCPIPERDASATPGEQSLTASATPDSLVYAPDGVACPFGDVISFQALLEDPPQDVAFVIVDYSVTGTAAGSYPGESFARTVILNLTSTFPAGTKLFEGSTNFSLDVTLRLFYGSEPGDVTWIARAIGRDGSEVLTDGPYTIPAEPCTPSGLSIPPFSPVLITPTFTSTPASDADCPPGTYFAPATNRCIAIQIVTSQPGGDGGGNACNPPPGGCGPTEYWSAATCSCQVLQ